MDLYSALIGFILVLVGTLILAIQYRIGDFDKRFEITQNTIGLFCAGIAGIIVGIYFIIVAV